MTVRQICNIRKGEQLKKSHKNNIDGLFLKEIGLINKKSKKC